MLLALDIAGALFPHRSASCTVTWSCAMPRSQPNPRFWTMSKGPGVVLVWFHDVPPESLSGLLIPF